MDDEREFLELVERFFEEKAKIDLDVTPSAKEGLDRLEEENYDAVVSDYKMPEMSGIEFLEVLRSRGDDIPFIIVTGKGEERIAMEALNKGANRYHQKSKNLENLFNEITQSIIEEVIRKKGETELKTFQKWIKNR